MKKVEMWQTKDGKTFHTQYEAEEHEILISFADWYSHVTAAKLKDCQAKDIFHFVLLYREKIQQFIAQMENNAISKKQHFEDLKNA